MGNKYSKLNTKVDRPYFKTQDPYQCQLYKVEEKKRKGERKRGKKRGMEKEKREDRRKKTKGIQL